MLDPIAIEGKHVHWLLVQFLSKLGSETWLIAENSACQAIYNVGWFSGSANALPTAKTALEITLAHTGREITTTHRVSNFNIGIAGKVLGCSLSSG